MGFSPFTPPFKEYRSLPASRVHLHLSSPMETAAPEHIPAADLPGPAAIASDPTVHLLPSCAAYVGADLTAGIFSSGLAYDDGPSLLVDVGTNGEIILKHGQTLLGCATAAGPAFEGSRLACGMRAGAGAISHIRIGNQPDGCENEENDGLCIEVDVIGNIKPTGICGSAYVDILAQARAAGLISPTGRFEEDRCGKRLSWFKDCTRGLRVAWGHGRESLVVTESDIASLMQAKAAIAAGILTLINKVGMKPSDIRTLYLAGGFGMHMDIKNAIGCGLLPGFTPGQIQLVGNTSLAGAYLALLDSGVVDELKRIASSVQTVELNLEPDFESTYIDQLQLPD